jgi:hypothetical protein
VNVGIWDIEERTMKSNLLKEGGGWRDIGGWGVGETWGGGETLLFLYFDVDLDSSLGISVKFN